MVGDAQRWQPTTSCLTILHNYLVEASEPKEIVMRTRSKIVLFMGIGGLSLAACGGPKVASSSTSTTLIPLKSAAAGFNAAKTEFVLPYKLGYLPGSELALAKADSAYASGLVNTQYWTQVQLHVPSKNASATQVAMLWVYVGEPATGAPQVAVTGTKANALSWNAMIAGIGGAGAVKILNSTPVAVSASTLNPLFTASSQFNSNALANGDRLVAPSMLEVLAAPTGTLAVGGTSLPAFCVPVPEAFVNSGGKLFNPSGFPVMIAGPSTVFGGSVTTTGSAPTGVLLYDQGVGSCANFH